MFRAVDQLPSPDIGLQEALAEFRRVNKIRLVARNLKEQFEKIGVCEEEQGPVDPLQLTGRQENKDPAFRFQVDFNDGPRPTKRIKTEHNDS